MPGAPAINATRVKVESGSIRFSTLDRGNSSVQIRGNRVGCLAIPRLPEGASRLSVIRRPADGDAILGDGDTAW